MDENTGISIMVMLTLAMISTYYGLRLYDYLQLRKPASMPVNSPKAEPIPLPPTRYNTATVPNAAPASQDPPTNLDITLAELQRHASVERYPIPIGWYLRPDGNGALSYVELVGGANHILITAMSDVGKDNLALTMMFSLAQLHTPKEVQFCVIDGKGLDFAGWANKAHTWRCAIKPTEIAPAMVALSAERERRGEILRAAGVSKWDEYTRGDLPLLFVYISELSLLEDAAGKSDLTQWLNSELASGRAFGIRYCVATQTASNFATRWRSQISLYIAGFQPSATQDQPNTGLTTKELSAVGGVPPSELPAPPEGAGVFTAVAGRKAITRRSTFLDNQQRRSLLAMLPDRAAQTSLKTSQTAPEPQTGLEPVLAVPMRSVTSDSAHIAVKPQASIGIDTTPKNGLIDVNSIPQEERDRIIELAQRGESRKSILREVYGGSGHQYPKVRAVLEAAGLGLQSQKTIEAQAT